MHRVPVDIVAEKMLPFLEISEIFVLGYTIRGLMEKNSFWKALCHGSGLFFSKPKSDDRKYKDFWRIRQTIRGNWSRWKPSSAYNESRSKNLLYISHLTPRTDSENIVICCNQPDTKESHYQSVLETYDMECNFIKQTNLFSICQDFDFKDGRVLTTLSNWKAGEDKRYLKLWCGKTLKNLGISKYRADSAVFQDVSTSFVYDLDGILYKVDLNHPSVRGTIVTNFKWQKHTFYNLKICKCTLPNRVVSFSRGNSIFVSDTRQNYLTAAYNMNTMAEVLEAGEHSIIYYYRNRIREIDTRFYCNSDSQITESPEGKGISNVYWTPDSFFVHISNNMLYAYKNNKWSARMQLPYISAVRRFDFTEKHMVCVAEESYTSHSSIYAYSFV